MNQYKRLLQVPKSYYVEREFPCSKIDSIRIIRQNHKKKKDFSTDEAYKHYITTEYYKKQIDNIIDLYDDNNELRVYILQKLIAKVHSL